MAVYSLAPTIGFAYQAFDNGGLPLAGGLIYSYIDGGTAPQGTYTSAQGDVANANPIVLDSYGRPPNEIWVNSILSYRFVLTDALGNQIRTFDGIPHVNYATGTNVYHQFSVQPSDATPNVSITPSVKCTLYNFDGSINTSISGSITVALGANPNGATLSGSVTQALVAGVTTYNNLKLNKVGLGCTLLAGAIGLDTFTATSAAFDVTADLSFTTQPSETTSGATISPAVVVKALSSDGSTVTTFTGNVTIALGTNPGGTLTGTLTVAAVAGVATFSNLVLTGDAGAYTLTATANELAVNTGTSSAFALMGTLSSVVLYTLPGSNVWGFDDPYTGANSFYEGVLYINYGVGASANSNAAVFAFQSQSTPINQQAFGAYHAIKGLISTESVPPGYAFMVGANTGFGYRMPFDSGAEGMNIGISDGRNMSNALSEDSISAIFAPTHVGGVTGQPLMRWTNLDWIAGTSTLNNDFGSLAATYYFIALVFNGTVINSRVYVSASANSAGNPVAPYRLAWVHSGTGVFTSLASFANPIASSILAGQFGGGPDTRLYNMSGNNGEANVVQKRSLDGVLLASVTIAAESSTEFASFTVMSYDYNASSEGRLWLQAQSSGKPIYCIDCATMLLIAHAAAPVSGPELIQPIAYYAGGVLAAEPSGTKLYRIEVA